MGLKSEYETILEVYNDLNETKRKYNFLQKELAMLISLCADDIEEDFDINGTEVREHSELPPRFAKIIKVLREGCKNE